MRICFGFNDKYSLLDCVSMWSNGYIDIAKKYENDCSSKGYFEGVISNQASIRGLESAIRIVKKYYS